MKDHENIRLNTLIHRSTVIRFNSSSEIKILSFITLNNK